MAFQNKFFVGFLIVCLTAVALTSAASTEECGANQELVNCYTVCNDTCFQGRIACEPPCNPGCQCKKGYKWKEIGKCIPEKQCGEF